MGGKGRGLPAGALLAMAVATAVGCGDGGGKGGAVDLSKPLPEETHPEAGAVRGVVERLLRANGTPEAAGVAQAVLSADALAKAGDLGRATTKFEWEVKRVEVWGTIALVRVVLRYPEVKAASPEAIDEYRMTYELAKGADGWRVTGWDLKGNWDDLGTR